MVRIRQAIVVEGRYDKNVLEQIVDAPIFTTDGFGVMKDRELLALLRAVADKRGLIIFTDPDGAGFVIRNYLKGTLPRDRVLHAYVPDVPGKERRKRHRVKRVNWGSREWTHRRFCRHCVRPGPSLRMHPHPERVPA